MKIAGKKWRTSMACILSILAASVANAGSMGAESVAPLGSVYLGAFGGGGGNTRIHLIQEGTALINYGSGSESINNGGPLAVNAFGQSNSGSVWLAGGQVGYRWSERSLNHFDSTATFAPATQLEGFYFGRSSIQGAHLVNETTRLMEHDFHVTYPTQTGVFLVDL